MEMEITHQGVIFFGSYKPSHLHNVNFRRLRLFIPQEQHNELIIAIFEDHVPMFVKNWIMEIAGEIPFRFFILPGGKEFQLAGHTLPIWSTSITMNRILQAPIELSYTSNNFGFWIVLKHSYEQIRPPWDIMEISWHNSAFGRFTEMNSSTISSQDSDQDSQLIEPINNLIIALNQPGTEDIAAEINNGDWNLLLSNIVEDNLLMEPVNNLMSALNQPGTEDIAAEMNDDEWNLLLSNIVEK